MKHGNADRYILVGIHLVVYLAGRFYYGQRDQRSKPVAPMNLSDITQAYNDNDDGLLHWSPGALNEAAGLVEQTLDVIARSYETTPSVHRIHLDAQKQHYTAVLNHIHHCRQVPAPNPATV